MGTTNNLASQYTLCLKNLSKPIFDKCIESGSAPTEAELAPVALALMNREIADFLYLGKKKRNTTLDTVYSTSYTGLAKSWFNAYKRVGNPAQITEPPGFHDRNADGTNFKDQHPYTKEEKPGFDTIDVKTFVGEEVQKAFHQMQEKNALLQSPPHNPPHASFNGLTYPGAAAAAPAPAAAAAAAPAPAPPSALKTGRNEEHEAIKPAAKKQKYDNEDVASAALLPKWKTQLESLRDRYGKGRCYYKEFEALSTEMITCSISMQKTPQESVLFWASYKDVNQIAAQLKCDFDKFVGPVLVDLPSATGGAEKTTTVEWKGPIPSSTTVLSQSKIKFIFHYMYPTQMDQHNRDQTQCVANWLLEQSKKKEAEQESDTKLHLDSYEIMNILSNDDDLDKQKETENKQKETENKQKETEK